MRSLGGQEYILGNPYRVAHARLKVDRTGSGGWVDLSDYEGHNWMLNVKWGDKLDSNCRQLTATLHRAVGRKTLATLVDGSKLNQGGTLIDIGRAVVLETATVGPDVAPVEADYREVFCGEIDEVDWSKPQVKVRCRDEGGALADKFIETISKRPSAAASDDVQDIMQEILDAEIGGVTLYSENGTVGTPFNAGDSPGWVVTEYFQQKQHLLEALRTLANMIGWDVKYGWQQNTDSYELIFKEPPRAVRAQGTLALTGLPVNNETFVINATTCTAKAAGPAGDQFLIGSDAAETATNIATMLNAETESANLYAWADGDDVIIEWNTPGTGGNAIVFTEALTNATADGGGTLGGTRAGANSSPLAPSAGGVAAADYGEFTGAKLTRRDIRNRVRVTFLDQNDLHTSVIRDDPPSQTKYGLRVMELTEDSSGQIDTIAEASKMATAALDDLKEPKLLGSVPMPYFWPVETGDLYTFAANDVHFDTAQNLAVIGYDHEIGLGGSVTKMQLRGEPAGGYKRWLGIEARQGKAAAAALRNPDAADNPAIEPAVGAIMVTYDDPRSMSPPVDDWAYTKCYVSDSGGFTPSAATLKAVGRQTRFEIGDLVPGTTYYAKLEIIDSSGNVGAVSAQVTVAAEKVGPYHTNQEQEWGPLNQNPNFGVHTLNEVNVPPDHWLNVATYGGWANTAGNWYFDTAEARTKTGNRSLKFNGIARPGAGSLLRRFESDFVVVEDGDLFVVKFAWQHDGNSGNRTQWGPFVEWYDKDQIIVSSTSLIDTLLAYSTAIALVTAPNVWYVDRGWTTAPATARYAKIRIYIVIPNTFAQTDHPTVWWDHFALSRTLAKFNYGSGTVDRNAAAGAWVRPWLEGGVVLMDNEGAFSGGINGIAADHEYLVQRDMEAYLYGMASFTAANNGTVLQSRISADGALLVQSQPTYYNGAGVIGAAVSTGPVGLSAGQLLRLEGRHNDGVARNLDDSECLFRVMQISDRGG